MCDREILDAICSAQLEAAELIMQAHGVLAECKSGQRDVVTEYDRRVQELLIERLRKAVPEAGFFCEESHMQDDLQAEHIFIIDPIDGTMNFVRGFQHSGISVAYMSRGELRASAIYNPYKKEHFTALRGEGAWLNGKSIEASPAHLSESIVCVGTAPYSPELAEGTFELIKRAFVAGLDIRREGAASLDMCSAAAGRAGVYFEPLVSLWDVAAGALLVEEAGGICCGLEGKSLPLDGRKTPVVAGGKLAVQEFLKIAGE